MSFYLVVGVPGNDFKGNLQFVFDLNYHSLHNCTDGILFIARSVHVQRYRLRYKNCASIEQ